jgi:hypothetical protein
MIPTLAVAMVAGLLACSACNPASNNGEISEVNHDKAQQQNTLTQPIPNTNTDLGDAKASARLAPGLQIHPSTLMLDLATSEQVAFIREHQHDMPIVQRTLEYANVWAANNVASIYRYKHEQYRAVAVFNAWMPLAVESHTAMEQFVECSRRIGFNADKAYDEPRFVASLEKTLDRAIDLVRAKVLGKNHRTSYANRDDDATALSTVRPALAGEPLTPTLRSMALAYSHLLSEMDRVSLTLLVERNGELNGHDDDIHDENLGIDHMTEFWFNLVESDSTTISQAKIDEFNAVIAGSVGHGTEFNPSSTMENTQAVFQVAVAAKTEFIEAMAVLGGQRRQDRQHDMAQFGDELDKYALAYKALLPQSTKDSGDIATYSSAMFCVATIENFRVNLELAIDTFPFDEISATYRASRDERDGRTRPVESQFVDTAKSVRAPPTLPRLEGSEQEVYIRLMGTYQQLVKQQQSWGRKLGGVSSRFEKLMKAVAGDTKHSIGKKY